ncbi:MAG: flagellar export chaperone FliS [Burkholderiales bacterium]|nr:flagellar export chaperone FliS [Burkholderiales bacterium]
MTSPRAALAAYGRVQTETDVATADPHKLVGLLFDAALAAVYRAAERMRARDFATKGTAISRAIQIIEQGLAASLDLSAGGELAARLAELYDYMSRRLLLASARNDPEGLEEVARLLAELREAWRAIGAESAKERAHGERGA